MYLKDIKNKLGIPTFQFNTASDVDGNPTEWFRHWDNENRVAVSIHKELAQELKSNPSISSLGLQHEIRVAEQGEYQAYRIVKFEPAEFTL